MVYVINYYASSRYLPADGQSLSLENEAIFSPDERLPHGSIAGQYAPLGQHLCILGRDRAHGLVFLLDRQWDVLQDMVLEHLSLGTVSRRLVVQSPLLGNQVIDYDIDSADWPELSWPVEAEDRDFGLWLFNLSKSSERTAICFSQWVPGELVPKEGRSRSL